MYEARQNKEKVSRCLSFFNSKNMQCFTSKENSLKNVFTNNYNIPIQRLVVMANDDYNTVTEERVWNNIAHAEKFSGGPIWDLQAHRTPDPDAQSSKQLRFVQHGSPGIIGIESGISLYRKMTSDEQGLRVMNNVESVIFQSCYAGKDYFNNSTGKESNLTAIFSHEIAKDDRLNKDRDVFVYGKNMTSFGFEGIGDYVAVLEDQKFNKHLFNVHDAGNFEGGGNIKNYTLIPSSYSKQWKDFLGKTKKGFFQKRRISKTLDGAEEGWKRSKNIDNNLIKKYLVKNGQVQQIFTNKEPQNSIIAKEVYKLEEAKSHIPISSDLQSGGNEH